MCSGLSHSNRQLEQRETAMLASSQDFEGSPHEWKQTGRRKEEFSWGDSWEVELGFSKMKDGMIILMIEKNKTLKFVNDLLLEKWKQSQRYLL